jgi:uncharacterized membrane protein YoaT (DUF817 family)
MSTEIYWYILFFILLMAYLLIQFNVKNKRKYFIYFLCGSILGFYFDIVSFTQGYYSYPDFYSITLLGLPLSMTLAEGFSVVITIYIVEVIRRYFSISLER